MKQHTCAWLENLHRHDTNSLDDAEAIQKLIDLGETQEDIAKTYTVPQKLNPSFPKL